MKLLSIDTISPEDFAEVLALWEASVRATHHFLKEKDLLIFRELVRTQYLGHAVIHCMRGNGKILAFMGVDDGNIDSLFVHPDSRGKGIGRNLVQFAIKELAATTVDVNEQNEQAIGFYEKLGFKTVGRSEVDGMGKPYPLLHMVLQA